MLLQKTPFCLARQPPVVQAEMLLLPLTLPRQMPNGSQLLLLLLCCPQSEKGERFTNQTVDIIANHLTVPYSLLLSLSIRLFCCPSLV